MLKSRLRLVSGFSAGHYRLVVGGTSRRALSLVFQAAFRNFASVSEIARVLTRFNHWLPVRDGRVNIGKCSFLVDQYCNSVHWDGFTEICSYGFIKGASSRVIV